MPKFVIPKRPPEYLLSKQPLPLPAEQIFRASSDGTYQRPYSSDSTGHFSPPVRSNSNYIIHASETDRFEETTKSNVNKNTHSFRVKNTHSNEWTNLEILAAKYAGLSGIAVPWTIFCIDAEKDNPDMAKDCAKRKDLATKPEDIPFYFVASQRLRGYQDFSTFLDYVYNNQLDYFFPKGDEVANEKRNSFVNHYAELTKLRNLPDTNHGEIKIQKRDSALGCFKLFPQEIKDMVDELYVVSAWLGNWDMFNWDLTNMGFTVLHKKDGTTEISPAIIDFGNCLYAGFGGKYKEDSLVAANTPAKQKANNPNDYEPEIPDNMKIKAAMFSAIPGLALANFPRRLAFDGLFEKNHLTSEEYIEQNLGETGELSKGFMRGLYRISQINDAAIDKVTDKWFLLGDKINYSNPDCSQHRAKEDLATLMKERKASICERFKKDLRSYQTNYMTDALLTGLEVNNATMDITDEKLKPAPSQDLQKQFKFANENSSSFVEKKSPISIQALQPDSVRRM